MTQTEVEVLEPPRKGTIPWLQLQEHVEWHGMEIPDVHRIPAGASRYDGPDDGKCRVIHAGDRGRCRAPRVRVYGICSAHLGGGDPEAASREAVTVRARLKSQRMLLGIGTSRVGNPRQIARLRALGRVEEIASALIDAPLDDAELGTVERQQAVLRALDATFPLQAMTVEVELPASAEGVQGMGWESMQRLASTLLDSEA